MRTTIKIIEEGGDHIEIDCFGEFLEDSNVIVKGWDDNYGCEYEEVYCNDDLCESWLEVVAVLMKWGKRVNVEIQELEAC